MSITFSSCFFNFNSKFHANTYSEWMKNFFSIVNDFYLVVYTNQESIHHIQANVNNNPRIKIIVQQVEEFYNYKYKDFWIKNHKKNLLLKDRIDWQVNMLWSEKLWFVNQTAKKNYFNTEYFGWCDIGYFRNRKSQDTNIEDLKNWSNPQSLANLDWTKIHYGCVNNNIEQLNELRNTILKKNESGLPATPINQNQVSFAGGFFLIHKNKIDWWCKTYEKKLSTYFHNDYLVKDDQLIVADCIFSNMEHFFVYFENTYPLDNWFMFQRILQCKTIIQG